MENVYKFFVTVFAAFGVFMAGMVVVTAVNGDEQPETDRAIATPTDFVNIQPRTVWPKELGPDGVIDKQIENGFLSSFEASSDVKLNADQRQVVKFVIVPRLKELTARSVDKAKARGLTRDEDIARVIIDDVMVNSPRYAKAMATILRVAPADLATTTNL